MYELHNKTHLKTYRRDLRKKQTKAERQLWKWLRGSTLGYKFRRQHSIDNYIVDFYCPELKLIIEVDGYIHGEEQQRIHDKQREQKLVSGGFHMLRIRNAQILFEEEATLLTIINTCDSLSVR